MHHNNLNNILTNNNQAFEVVEILYNSAKLLHCYNSYVQYFNIYQIEVFGVLQGESNEWLIQSRMHQMEKISNKPSNEPNNMRKIFNSDDINSPSLLQEEHKLPLRPLQSFTTLRKSRNASQRDSSIEDELFYSIESKDVGRKVASNGSAKMIPDSNVFSSGDSVQGNNYEENQICRVKSESEKLGEWMRSEYAQKGRGKYFQVRSAVRLRVQGEGITGLLIHKLDDFKVSIVNDSHSPAFSLFNKSKTLSAHFFSTVVGSSSSRLSQVSAFYRIQCCTLALTDLLRLFKCREMLRALHGFTQVALCRVEGWTGLNLPMLYTMQGKRQFHLAWKIGEAQSADQQGQQIIQVGFSMDEGESNWQRLMKYYLSKKGYIEIYVESCEQAGPLQGHFFKSKFTSLQKLLLKRRVIDK